MTQLSTPPSTKRDESSDSLASRLIRRITRLEMIVAAVIAAIMLVLVVLEPRILEAPFENSRTLLFTVGGTILAGIALVAMLWLRVPPVVRLVVLVVPFAIVNWWLISPYFMDDVVAEDFSGSIAEQLATSDAETQTTAVPPSDDEPVTSTTAAPTDDPAATSDDDPAEPTEEEPPPAPTGPVLLGAGEFIGLAGHTGTGDAGIFESPDGSLVLRFENFDIQNGPDLEVYLVPGTDQTSLADGSIHLGELKGNIGDQNYELPEGTELSGAYTVLVWCEAFSVEFVGATIDI
ncbi:MAG: DM13 domain-containing protein [Acidimicrobiia bacterium]|nr:DM13 domain-containing protein [Acidimicrobiia bacterium]